MGLQFNIYSWLREVANLGEDSLVESSLILSLFLKCRTCRSRTREEIVLIPIQLNMVQYDVLPPCNNSFFLTRRRIAVFHNPNARLEYRLFFAGSKVADGHPDIRYEPADTILSSWTSPTGGRLQKKQCDERKQT